MEVTPLGGPSPSVPGGTSGELSQNLTMLYPVERQSPVGFSCFSQVLSKSIQSCDSGLSSLRYLCSKQPGKVHRVPASRVEGRFVSWGRSLWGKGWAGLQAYGLSPLERLDAFPTSVSQLRHRPTVCVASTSALSHNILGQGKWTWTWSSSHPLCYNQVLCLWPRSHVSSSSCMKLEN